VWRGLDAGRGRLRGRQLTVTAQGRGAAAALRRVEVWLPKVSGVLAPVATNHPADHPVLTVVPGGSAESWTPSLDLQAVAG
jgi:hypothetical protein